MDFKVAQQEDEIELVCSEPADLIPGYTLMEKMGDGSLTTVYKVCKQGINEIFAAKVLRSQFSTSPRTVKRFVQEAKKATVLNNPHVVSVYEVGKTTTGQPFVICDFVDGGTLAERLAAEGRLDDLTTVDMLLQICEGLKSAHNNDFIHRDINPGNIVFKNTAEGQLAKLADFGIAKALPGPGRETKYTTPEGDSFGDPTYMCPEQIQGQRMDGRSDIYALGCVAYECLAGRPPFTGPNKVAVGFKHLEYTPAPLHPTLPSFLPTHALELIIKRMLAKDPAERFQSVEDLQTALEAVRPIVSGESVPANASPSRPPERKRGRLMGLSSRDIAIASAIYLLCVSLLIQFLIKNKMEDRPAPASSRASAGGGGIAMAGGGGPSPRAIAVPGGPSPRGGGIGPRASRPDPISDLPEGSFAYLGGHRTVFNSLAIGHAGEIIGMLVPNPSGGDPLPPPGTGEMGRYLANMRNRIRLAWSATAGSEYRGVVVSFVVDRLGRVNNLQVLAPRTQTANAAALAAVQNAAPFGPLPDESIYDLKVEFTFDNTKPERERFAFFPSAQVGKVSH